MASYGVLEEHITLDPDFSILAFAFCWACGLSWNEAWANVKSSLLDIPMSIPVRKCIGDYILLTLLVPNDVWKRLYELRPLRMSFV
jgi:TRAP-type C4-dicarboxylate transport system permease small subunit